LDASTGFSVDEIYVSDQMSLFGEDTKVLPPTFASGTQELYVVIKLTVAPPDGTNISIAVSGNAGPVEMESGIFTFSTVEGVFTLSYPLKPTSGGFDDGQYQATVSLGAQPVAVLNWTVGE
jgi:hypothetical protein